MENEKKPYMRKVRSFVKREGRITPGQHRALDDLLPMMGVDHLEGPLDFEQLFARNADTILEIGFGMGQSLLAQAMNHPENNYLGIEVHRPGVGSLLKGVGEHQIENLRVSFNDAIEVLEEKISDNSLAGVQLFFPDPWHKKKHHKRRIVNNSFVKKLHEKLKPGGFFHLATDWENYAEHMLEVLSEFDGFENTSKTDDYVERPEHRPLTKFEKRGHRLGHGVWDLMFIRNQD